MPHIPHHVTVTYSLDRSTCVPPQGNALEDPWVSPSESMFTRSVSPEQAPDEPTVVEIEFEKVRLSRAASLPAVNLRMVHFVTACLVSVDASWRVAQHYSAACVSAG